MVPSGNLTTADILFLVLRHTERGERGGGGGGGGGGEGGRGREREGEGGRGRGGETTKA